MSVSLIANNSLYAYNGTLLNLLGIDVAFSVEASVSGVITDDDGSLAPGETASVAIEGGADEAMTYIGSGTASGLLSSTNIMAFSTGSGTDTQIYIYAPDGFPLLSGVVVSLNIDDTASFDLAPSTPGVVDGTSGDDDMDVYENDEDYEDDDGDRITDYKFLVQSGNDTIYGYAGNDTIHAGSGDDEIYGGTGNDIIFGGDGEDIISGGDGNDTIYGGELGFGGIEDEHQDRIDGGAGDDTIFAGDGDNIVYGGDGDDTIYAGDNNDYIVGGEGNDTITSGDGVDTIYGGADDDIIDGGDGDDTVYGGAGNDTWLAGETTSGSDNVFLEDGDDTAEFGYVTVGTDENVDGGDGNDTLSLDADVMAGLDLDVTLMEGGAAADIDIGGSDTLGNFTNFENILGNDGSNTLTGNSEANKLWGAEGADTLDGGAGDDILDGGAGSDTISGGDGDDTFIIGSAAEAGGDSITGGSGPDDTTDIDTVDLSSIDPDSYTINATEDPLDSGALTGTVNFDTGEVLSFSGIEIICFTKGTEIITSEGPVAVENLKTGDLVMTMDHGMQPLRWMGRKKLNSIDLEASPKLKPIKIAAGALGNGTPLNDLMVSRQHRILVRSAIADRMFGVQEILVAAIKLVGHPGIEVVEDAESVEYFHMLFDQHEIVFSNGAATESLFTGPEALKAVSEDARAEILELFPDIATQTALLPARHIPQKGGMVKRFVERHAKNNKALMS
ncbi:Hint domain-containing protein [Celeribacter halophilus]|uniref:Ca2+-binding protein, RTX toxin-related n=1 Tax=Celeribacter halophilus TaxID=576117 RepID=A0A1I3NNW4_9RHOB|nr:Hint domain-containing protein [Celeribacter halophilus]PZX14570.1 Ca2+-binding RTX toxin-like protein [Celeribacter halophilus]SFJ10456.1 Ca2+-binding protein, RTX toxin-related [Celeribacter halophilus]